MGQIGRTGRCGGCDVTSAVQAGTFNFILTTASSDSLIVSSREGAQDPQLVITHT